MVIISRVLTGMIRLTLGLACCLATFVWFSHAGAAAAQPAPDRGTGQDALETLSRGALTAVGKLKTRPTAEIPASRFSIGFETLDRKMFDPERVYPHLAGLGAKWARVQTGWSQCEKVKGRYDFAWLDKIVDSLRAIGVQPWFNVTYGNRLYTPAAPHETAVGWSPIFTAEAREGWVNFVTALTRHYQDRVSRYEVWNEPDITGFWTPGKPDPEQYTKLVKITSQAIRGQFPQATILGGALAQTARLDFLEQCLAAGMANYIDALTYHVYVPTPETFYDRSLPAMRALLERMAPGLEAWQGESGVPSLAQKGQALDRYVWTEERQAKWAARRLMLDLAHGVPFIAQFHASDFMFYIVKDQIVNKRYYFGLVGGEDYAPKPAYYACQSIFNLFAGEPKISANVRIKILTQNESDDSSATRPRGYGFDTANGLLLGYWQGADTQKPWTPGLVTLEVSARDRDLPQDPVLLDPITQTIYRIDRSERLGGNTCRFAGLPLVDWPLLIADKSALPMVHLE